jgi:hypothetical protein
MLCANGVDQFLGENPPIFAKSALSHNKKNKRLKNKI